jgi:multidrug transporter EmrE-like cation transporter
LNVQLIIVCFKKTDKGPAADRQRNLSPATAIGYTGAAVPQTARNALFLLCYLVFVTGANVLLKLSAQAIGVWPFILLQAAGNLAGFAGVLAYTGLLRTLPLHVAFPLSRGLVILGVQLAAALLVFHESFRPTEAAGAVLVGGGIILVALGGPRQAGSPG